MFRWVYVEIGILRGNSKNLGDVEVKDQFFVGGSVGLTFHLMFEKCIFKLYKNLKKVI